MPDYTAHETAADFRAASEATAAPSRETVTLEVDADIAAWFRANPPSGMTWEQDMASALRRYAEDMQAMERAAAEYDAMRDHRPDFIAP